MRRLNYTRAGVVDAAIILKEILGVAYAEQVLTQEGLPQSVIARVLGDVPSERRSQYKGDKSGR